MNPEPQGGPARRMLRLADDRRLDRVGRDQAQAELAEAGFTEAGAALQALDQLLGSAAADLPAGPLLAGAAAAADPTRALINAARLATTAERPACPVDLGELARFLGASQHMAELILSRPERLADLGRPFNLREAEQRYAQAAALDERAAALRRLLARDTLAIAWADLIGGADVELVTRLLSALADIAVGAAARGLGSDRHFAVIALGKLGGFELNYSSDIDLIFVRPDSVTDQASADRAAGALVRLVGQQTADGHLYRVDMRLRPEGASGQLTRTLSSCLAYYRSVGRPWERQMLTKARVLADCGDAGAGFVAGTREWILGCGLDAGAIRQFKRLKAATEERHGGPEARADIKHAPGGIRDIETIAQFLALLHARVHPAAVTPSTLLTLEKLRVAGAIGTLEAARLRDAYRFFRRVENLLQVLHRVQTHRLPADRRPLARLLGLRDVEAFDDALTEHRQRVRALFERHFSGAFPVLEGEAAEISELALEGFADEERALRRLADAGFARPPGALAALRRAAAPVSRFLPSSPRLASVFASVAPALLERLALAPDPDAALDRFERMTRGVGAREVLYAQLGAEPRFLDLLAELAGGSPYLADLLASDPHIVDDCLDALLTGLRGRQRRRELLAGLRRAGDEDPWLLLSDHKKLETLRIGLLDLQDALPVREVLAELSRLCIEVLRHAFAVCFAQAVRQSGEPSSIAGLSGRRSAAMTVLALGKVGGLEANYASDADLVFVYSADGETDTGLPNNVFFSRVAEEFIARVGGARGGPRLYRIDTRLRPEGAKGPLVTSARAFEAYYRSPRAALFEHQAMLKARVVAGDAELGQQLLSALRARLRQLGPLPDLALRLREMRAKIEAGAESTDLKRGTGGMVDIEFLTQYLQLRHAADHAAVLVAETPRALELLAERGILPDHVARELSDTYLFFRRVEMRLQIALGLDTKEVPRAPEACRQLGLRLGYADTAEGDAGHALLVDLERATTETRRRFDELLI